MARPSKKQREAQSFSSILPSVQLPGGGEARRYKPQGKLEVDPVRPGEPSVNLRVMLPKYEWLSLHLWALAKGVSETEAIRHCLKRVVPTLEVFLVGKDPEAEAQQPILAPTPPDPAPAEDYRSQVAEEVQARTVEVREALKLPAQEAA